MKTFRSLPHFIGMILLAVLFSCNPDTPEWKNCLVEKDGAIIRTDTTQKEINLVFTAHDFADGFPTIIQVLRNQDIRASFFLTGDFYRNPGNRDIINTLKSDGHYLGAHSGHHLLFCSWENRDSLLVSREQFINDLKNNYDAMKDFGITKENAPVFLPAYEWYNRKIYEWTKEEGLTLVNFSPGTSSNADYTYPDLGKSYMTADTIYNRIIQYEKKNGLNGFILLIHPGTDPRRPDKLYNRLDELITYLKSGGYRFTRIDEH